MNGKRFLIKTVHVKSYLGRNNYDQEKKRGQVLEETGSGLAFQQFPIGQALSAVSDSQAMPKTETEIGLAE